MRCETYQRVRVNEVLQLEPLWDAETQQRLLDEVVRGDGAAVISVGGSKHNSQGTLFTFRTKFSCRIRSYMHDQDFTIPYMLDIANTIKYS